ncbi:MAG: FadR family transcriptional regulator [Aestuariivirga sp.]|nr:FadR family transcriptional regulator [Aestuariivirga sp.]
MTSGHGAGDVPGSRRAHSASEINAALMQAIREGRYRPGAQLPNERQLAEQFGTSRQQVRDALLILSESGLISRKVGSGTWLSGNAPQIIERLDADVDITAPHEHSFLETVEARLMMEPGVAALAARNVSEDHVATLRMSLDAIRAPCNWLEFKSRIYQFSRAYYVAANNSFLLRAFDLIAKARADHRFDGRRDNTEVADIVRDHTYVQLSQIFRAIADGDETRAETVTRSYLLGLAAASGLS